jgi:catechol 2,3-dioxygenase-like lactoylglutathione lyase family enzyme
MSSPAPIDRVLETCLYAEDVERTGRFYEEVLGLHVLARGAGRHVFFRVGRGMLLLFQPERTAESSEVPAHGATGPGHVAFAVARDELESWRARLRSAGIEIEREIAWPRGGHSIYLRDPAGNSVELATADIWPLGD